MPDHFNNARHRFYSAKHFQSENDIPETYNALKLIPDNASVSAHSTLVPHLAFRDSIYEYPEGKNADYIVMQRTHGCNPCDEKCLDAMRSEYKNDAKHEIVYDKNNVIIIKKK